MAQKAHNYFEGILQLRNSRDEVIESILTHVKNQKNKNIFISRMKDTRNGIDFYFSDRRYIQKLGRMLQKEFGGILKISPQLFSKSHLTSKDLYRVNVSFRLLDVKKGEVIKIDEKVVKITSIDKKIRGIDLLTAKKKNFDLKERYKKLETAETVVVKTKPKLEVLHPETYQSTTLENPVVTKKEKVVVAVDGNKLWLVE